MQPQQQRSRIDLRELKAQLVKKLGPENSKQYFDYLSRLLSKKLCKTEFEKFCFKVIGRENLPLHNQFIRSILKNACHAKTPPTIHEGGRPKSAIQLAKNFPSKEDKCEQGLPTVSSQHQNVSLLSNGVLPALPKRCRSGNRGKSKDRSSPLGPNGKLDSVLNQTTDRTVLINGDLAPCQYQRPVCNLQGVAEQPDNEVEGLAQQPAKRLKVGGKDWHAVGSIKDGEEAEQLSFLKFSRGPLLAPLGIPYCSASIGGARKTTPVSSTGNCLSYRDGRELSDTETVRKQMEQIAVAQGLGGVSVDCANLVNKMLDVYLKRLIKPCVELAGSRHAKDPKQQHFHKQQVKNKIVNGMWLKNHMHIQSGISSMQIPQEQRPQSTISMLDLRVAMELNPQQLGEDWPLQLEKICLQSFE